MQGLLFFAPILSSVRQDSSTRLSVEPTRFTVDLEAKKNQLSRGADEERSPSRELCQANSTRWMTVDTSNFGIRISNLRELQTLLLAALSSYGLMWSVTSNIMGCLRCRSNPKCTTVTSARPRCRTSTASSCAPGVAIRETAPIRRASPRSQFMVHRSRQVANGYDRYREVGDPGRFTVYSIGFAPLVHGTGSTAHGSSFMIDGGCEQ